MTYRASISVDANGKFLAAYFTIRTGKIAKTCDVSNTIGKPGGAGKAFSDYDQWGNLLGIEVLAPCVVSVDDLKQP